MHAICVVLPTVRYIIPPQLRILRVPIWVGPIVGPVRVGALWGGGVYVPPHPGVFFFRKQTIYNQARIQGGGGVNKLFNYSKKKSEFGIFYGRYVGPTVIWCLSTLDPPSARAPEAPAVHGRRWPPPPAKNPGSAPVQHSNQFIVI